MVCIKAAETHDALLGNPYSVQPTDVETGIKFELPEGKSTVVCVENVSETDDIIIDTRTNEPVQTVTGVPQMINLSPVLQTGGKMHIWKKHILKPDVDYQIQPLINPQTYQANVKLTFLI